MDAEEEEEIRHLFGPVPEPGGAAYHYHRAINFVAAAARRLLGLEALFADPWAIGAVEHHDEETKARSAARASWPAAALSALRSASEWMPLASTSFPRPDPYPIGPGEPVDILQDQRLREDMFLRSALLRRQATNRKLVIKCLDLYNSNHPMNQLLLKPTRSMVFLFVLGGLLVVMAALIAFARRGTYSHLS